MKTKKELFSSSIVTRPNPAPICLPQMLQGSEATVTHVWSFGGRYLGGDKPNAVFVRGPRLPLKYGPESVELIRNVRSPAALKSATASPDDKLKLYAAALDEESGSAEAAG